jgi:hypothetical protein
MSERLLRGGCNIGLGIGALDMICHDTGYGKWTSRCKRLSGGCQSQATCSTLLLCEYRCYLVAAVSSSTVTSSIPYAMFLAIVVANSCVSCATTPTCLFVNVVIQVVSARTRRGMFRPTSPKGNTTALCVSQHIPSVPVTRVHNISCSA